jgi:hypothetical protein
MKRNTLFLIPALTALTAVSAVAVPMNVKTKGTKAQTVAMCPDCKTKISCAKVGDYTIGLAVDQEYPKLGKGKVFVHVKKGDEPVTDAKVELALSMPNHHHADKPLTLKHEAHGRYVGSTAGLNMTGAYAADVTVTPAGGDAVKQSFTFAK